MKNKDSVILYKARPLQSQIHKELNTHRFNVLVTHRRFGKTVLAVVHTILKALKNPLPNAQYFYIAPFFNQAKSVAWDYFCRYTEHIKDRSVNESKSQITLPNGAKIRIFGADNPDALRGMYADGIVLDEYGDIKPNLFTEILLPEITDRNGWALFFGTPKGQNQFYEIFNKAQKEYRANPAGEWYAGIFPADKTKVIDETALENIRRITPDQTFRQEFLCDFTASSANMLITTDEVMDAQKRFYKEDDLRGSARIIGVDPARYGDDRSVIIRRYGLQTYPPKVYGKLNNVTLAGLVAEEIRSFRPDSVFIDAGQGAGVIDLLRSMGFDCIVEVPFGSTAINKGKYKNKRAEIWGLMADWVRAGGALPTEPVELGQELTIAKYDFDGAGRIFLEEKKQIKEILGKSPDLADALALTFSFPVSPREEHFNHFDVSSNDSYEVAFEL